MRRLTGALGLLLAVGCLFATSALAADTHILSGSFGAAGSTPANPYPLGSPQGIAVDESTGDVYVADSTNARVEKFDSSGNLILILGKEVDATTSADVCVISSGDTCQAGASSSSPGGFVSPAFLAVDNSSGLSEGDLYVGDPGDNRVSKFASDGTLVSSWGTGGQLSGGGAEAFVELAGIAVNPAGPAAGNLNVFEAEPQRLVKFDDEGTFEGEIETPRGTMAFGLAVDPDGNFFKVNGSPNVEKFEASGTDIAQVSIPESAAGLAVDSSSGALYVDNGGSIDEFAFGPSGEVLGSGCTPIPFSGCPATNSFGVGDVAAGTGLGVDSGLETVYVSDSAGGSGRIDVFSPPPPVPPSIGEATVANVTATSANLRAQVNPHFFDTHYRFQYVTQAEFEAGGFSGAKETPEADLGPAGIEQTAGAHLSGLVPDTSYRFRVVAENENGTVTNAEPAPRFNTFPAFSGLPDGRAYEMVSPPQKQGNVYPPEPSRSLSGTCNFCMPGFDREKMPMQSSPDGDAVVYEGEPFSAGLASGPNEYLATRGPAGWQTSGLSLPVFETEEPQGFKAFSGDLTRGVMYGVEPALSPEAPTAEGKSYANLYLWEGGTFLPLVVDKPPHRTAGRQDEARFRLVYAGANSGATSESAFSHVIFAANDALTKEVPGVAPEAPGIEASSRCAIPGENCDLYEWVGGRLRLVNVLPGNTTAASGFFGAGLLNAENDQLESPDFDNAISVDGSHIFWSDGATGQVYVRIDAKETREVPDPGRFLTASTDGSKVLLTDGRLYDLDTSTLTDLTGGSGEFQGILGASEDLSRVYFVDKATLTPPGEENANQEHAEAGKDNLYMWDSGSLAFIGVLLEGYTDNPSVVGTWKPSPANRTAQVSPDGRYLAFMSAASLTGYDNTVSLEGENKEAEKCGINVTKACSEVFEYDASSENLSCVSCNPTGERPLGRSNLSLIKGAREWFQQPENLTSDGRIFFESQDVLSPRDTNGHIQDVYEWEPNGVGSCKRSGGCISLISGGASKYDTSFINATPSGSDAFFVTNAPLLLRDKDELFDVYDARVNGGLPAETETTRGECQGEACQPAAIVPNDPTPASSSFSGAGNPVAKQKHHRRKKHKRHARGRHHKRAVHTNRGGAK